MSDRTQPSASRVVVFGEVLFDCFAGGREVLGGAPFNVAWHLAGFGAEPLLVSRVGDDERGRRILEAMADWGMRRDATQVDPDHPTGVVTATVERGQPTFHIQPDQAYDFIDIDPSHGPRDVLQGLLYHGSLALRSAAPRQSLAQLRALRDRSVFIDVNLRAPWWERERVEATLSGACWVKLNEQELGILTDCECASSSACVEAGRALAARHSIRALIVTRGADGALWLERDEEPLLARPHPVSSLVDTVGAGDAFAAVSILGALRGWRTTRTLERAVEFAARICGIQGATLFDRSLYDEVDRRWIAEDDGGRIP